MNPVSFPVPRKGFACERSLFCVDVVSFFGVDAPELN